MNRKEITKFLSDLLERTVLSGIGIYYASEVVVDYGTAHPKRIDYLQYTPRGALYAGDIENGSFTCYEVKSCKEDVYSGSGLNFLGEENYIVTTMACYKSLLQDINSGKLNNHIREMNGGRLPGYKFLLAVPDRSCGERFNGNSAITEEFENETPLGEGSYWRYAKLSVGNESFHRIRSTAELLFCMVRSGR